MLKRVISVVLTLSMLFSLTINAFASEKEFSMILEIEGVKYSISQSQDCDGNLVTIVESKENGEYAKIIRDGNVLYFDESIGTEKYNNSILSNTDVEKSIKVIDLDEINISTENAPAVKATAVQSTPFWGYYAYYNDNPSGPGDMYRVVKHGKKSPSQIYYYTYDNTQLEDVSKEYYKDVVAITGQQNAAIAVIGFGTAATIASAIFSGNPVTSAAGIAGIIVSISTGAVGTIGFFTAAWISSQYANTNYDEIVRLLRW